MVTRTELDNYCSELLNIAAFKDYCPNGLQVQGKSEIKTLVTGVTACQALLDKAIALNADAVMVHHGYFWKGEAQSVTGMKRNRLSALLKNDVSLFAYHLPLDAHPELGNNAQLGQLLGFQPETTPASCDPLVWFGTPSKQNDLVVANEIVQRIESILGRKPLHIAPDGDKPIQRIAWCTGAAQSYFEQAIAAGADAFISGEISEPTVHIARELGAHYFSAGHHATERYGVKALGEHLAERFDIEHHFVDIDSPV